MSSHSLMHPVIAGSIIFGFVALAGCSDDGPSVPGTGGTPGAGGATGGGSSGGAASGGAASGGAATGGAASGGAASGGAASGGAASGGAGTGGDGTGGAATGGADGTGGDGTGGGSAEFTLTSAALTDMGAFADVNTCAGGVGLMGFGEAIPLEWSGFPAETQSFALTMIDVTLVDGQDNYLGCHSAFWNVPVTTTSMPDADWAPALSGAQSIRSGYLGPCPNFGGGTNEDTYEFTLYAMGDATLSDPAIDTGAFGNLESCNALRQALDDAALAKVTLTGTSDASN